MELIVTYDSPRTVPFSGTKYHTKKTMGTDFEFTGALTYEFINEVFSQILFEVEYEKKTKVVVSHFFKRDEVSWESEKRKMLVPDSAFEVRVYQP